MKSEHWNTLSLHSMGFKPSETEYSDHSGMEHIAVISSVLTAVLPSNQFANVR